MDDDGRSWIMDAAAADIDDDDHDDDDHDGWMMENGP